ncbi:hypothetical protein [Scandinavium hiltneri]|uniref:hypothetical protein n=1 Tax=Scandinavium hiltneri TaxID=2926519 RepID=UPI0035B4BB76
MIILLKPLKWSPDGCRIETIDAGEHEELPARAIEIAGQIGILGETKSDGEGDVPPAPNPDDDPPPPSESDPDSESGSVVDEKPQKNAKK